MIISTYVNSQYVDIQYWQTYLAIAIDTCIVNAILTIETFIHCVSDCIFSLIFLHRYSKGSKNIHIYPRNNTILCIDNSGLKIIMRGFPQEGFRNTRKKSLLCGSPLVCSTLFI